ncbi:MAG: SH3 domain-containing protein [Acidobacteria bacterium]|nr:SH3 domain-containing protein [Acidobacteriota bacterium]
MKYLCIKEDKVNIRERLERGSPNIGTLNKGDIVKELASIVREGEVWYQIETRDKVIGYIKAVSAYRMKLVLLIPIFIVGKEYARKRNRENAPLFTEPSFKSGTDMKIKPGRICWIMDEIENKEGNWYKIRLYNKKEYFIEKTHQISERLSNPPAYSFQTPIHRYIEIMSYPLSAVITYAIIKTLISVEAIVFILVSLGSLYLFATDIIKTFFKLKM